MKRDKLFKIEQRAYTRKDGIYTLAGTSYLVKKKMLRAFIENNAVMEVSGIFCVQISKRFDLPSQAKEAMKELLK